MRSVERLGRLRALFDIVQFRPPSAQVPLDNITQRRINKDVLGRSVRSGVPVLDGFPSVDYVLTYLLTLQRPAGGFLPLRTRVSGVGSSEILCGARCHLLAGFLIGVKCDGIVIRGIPQHHQVDHAIKSTKKLTIINPVLSVKKLSEKQYERARFLDPDEETALRLKLSPEHLAELDMALNAWLAP